MQIDFVRYTIIKIIILASLIGMVFRTNTDFPYELSLIFTIIFIIEMLFVWAIGEKKIKKMKNSLKQNTVALAPLRGQGTPIMCPFAYGSQINKFAPSV